eukprot:Rhum_TRINITY_DN15236_c0_g1::Rhum_TRINITY_DN15236_c0_g1_i2::g.145958::m.145958
MLLRISFCFSYLVFSKKNKEQQQSGKTDKKTMRKGKTVQRTPYATWHFVCLPPALPPHRVSIRSSEYWFLVKVLGVPSDLPDVAGSPPAVCASGQHIFVPSVSYTYATHCASDEHASQHAPSSATVTPFGYFAVRTASLASVNADDWHVFAGVAIAFSSFTAAASSTHAFAAFAANVFASRPATNASASASDARFDSGAPCGSRRCAPGVVRVSSRFRFAVVARASSPFSPTSAAPSTALSATSTVTAAADARAGSSTTSSTFCPSNDHVPAPPQRENGTAVVLPPAVNDTLAAGTALTSLTVYERDASWPLNDPVVFIVTDTFDAVRV